jgi:hypothetical protein
MEEELYGSNQYLMPNTTSHVKTTQQMEGMDLDAAYRGCPAECLLVRDANKSNRSRLVPAWNCECLDPLWSEVRRVLLPGRPPPWTLSGYRLSVRGRFGQCGSNTRLIWSHMRTRSSVEKPEAGNRTREGTLAQMEWAAGVVCPPERRG